MYVIATQLVTGDETRHATLKEFCDSISIPEEYLQLDFKHPKFKDGVFQKYRYSWYEIWVYETLENCLSNPLPAVVLNDTEQYSDLSKRPPFVGPSNLLASLNYDKIRHWLNLMV